MSIDPLNPIGEIKMKVQGALWKKFYNDEEYWKDYFHDDTLVMFDGVEQEDYESPANDAVVKVESGYVYTTDSYNNPIDLVTFFRRWKKIQSTTVIVVTVEKDSEKSIRQQIRQLDGVKAVG